MNNKYVIVKKNRVQKIILAQNISHIKLYKDKTPDVPGVPYKRLGPGESVHPYDKPMRTGDKYLSAWTRVKRWFGG